MEPVKGEILAAGCRPRVACTFCPDSLILAQALQTGCKVSEVFSERKGIFALVIPGSAFKTSEADEHLLNLTATNWGYFPPTKALSAKKGSSGELVPAYPKGTGNLRIALRDSHFKGPTTFRDSWKNVGGTDGRGQERLVGGVLGYGNGVFGGSIRAYGGTWDWAGQAPQV